MCDEEDVDGGDLSIVFDHFVGVSSTSYALAAASAALAYPYLCMNLNVSWSTVPDDVESVWPDVIFYLGTRLRQIILSLIHKINTHESK